MNESLPHTHSLFEQPWWLDATAPGQWDAVEVQEGGRTVARLPFVVRKKHGFRALTQPPLTQTLGPWVEQLSQNPSKHLAREKELLNALIARLPPHDVFQQAFHANVTNWLPFYWTGFSQTTYYSYAFDDLTDHDHIYRGFSKTTRQQVERTSSRLYVDDSGSIDDLLHLADHTYQRQGLTLPYPRDLLYRIDDAVKRHATRQLLIAKDEAGAHHAAIYVIGDERRAYSIVTGTHTEHRQSGAINLLYWEAIKAASQHSRVFDFEGSMIPGVEEFYRKFGGVQVPYFAVRRSSGAARIGSLLRQIMSR